MTDHLVVLDVWPPADVQAAAQAWATMFGGTAMDHARQLRACKGIAAQRLSEVDARSLATALTDAGALSYAVHQSMMSALPRPLTASRLDPSHEDALYTQVKLTGPPEKVPWRQIVLVLPARKQITRTTTTVTKEKVGIGTAALALSTGIGAGKVIKAIRNKGGDVQTRTDHSSRELVEIVAVGPLRRIHAYGDRLDYSVLGKDRVQGKGNFPRLLSQLLPRLRPELASHGALRRFIKDGGVPASLHIGDNNELAAMSRWLLLRSAARRLATRR